MNELIERLTLLACLAILAIFLPLEYLQKDRKDGRIISDIQELERRIRAAEGRDFSIEHELPRLFNQKEDPSQMFRGQRILGGTCFYELWEIENFLVRKLQEKDTALSIYPPMNLKVGRVNEGLELSWSDNPRNQQLVKKMMNNPLLSINYKVYRWNSGRQSQPQVIAVLPYDLNQYIDKDIGLLGLRYFYNVVTAYGGRIGEHETLIESRQSETVEFACADRFRLRILSGKPERVQVEVSIESGGTPYSQVFSVAVGDEIGGWVESPEGRRNLSTSLKVRAILSRQETRQEGEDRPVFNADGSRTLDPITQKPLFQNRPIVRDLTLYSLECEDPWGGRRIVE